MDKKLPPLTQEQKEEQALRAYVMMRKQNATSILNGLVMNPAIISYDGTILIEKAVKAAILGADLLLEGLSKAPEQVENTEK